MSRIGLSTSTMASLLSKVSVPTMLAVATLAAGQALAQNQAPSSNGDGFLTGLRGFEAFHEPVGQPIYFESPFNDSGLRALYLKHEFSDGSFLQGGDVTVYALQARLALTERLQFIATKDGYSEFDSGLLGEDEGWNDIAGGLKYVLVADREGAFALSTGARYMAEHGHRLYGVINGNVGEVSPFVAVAKGFGDLHTVGNVTLRVPTDSHDGNVVGHWDVHVDYDINPKSDIVFAPTVEVHGVHYLDDGDTALPIGGLDYTNLGSQPAEHFVAWAGVGFRAEMMTKYEFGFVYEFALTDKDDDIMDKRITIDLAVRF